jgi:methionyl-tRNA formyltransferase
MKIVYMGTPLFAVAPLEALIDKRYNVVLAVTQPDRSAGRGEKMQSPPVKTAALSRGIPVLQPERVRGNAEFFRELEKAEPDLIVVAAYGKILPMEILKLPPMGCVNIHASLLPKYRGAAPIHHAVINGETETGVTLMHMSEGMDEGDIIASRRIEIGRKTTETLFAELSALGAGLLADTAPYIESGRAKRIPQDSAAATYAPMLSKADAMVNFSKSPEEIERLIRGMNSRPGAWAKYRGKTMKLFAAEAVGEKSRLPYGSILRADKNGIAVSAGGGVILLTEIQAPGRRSMRVSEFIKGNEIDMSAVFNA